MAMMTEPRPKLWGASTAAYLGLLALGLALFGLSFRVWGDVHLHGTPVVNGDTVISLDLSNDAHWYAILINGIALGMVTVSAFELLRLVAAHPFYWFGTRAQLNSFFGPGASENSGRGCIVLQSDTMDGGDNDPNSRFYKARTWVNKCDADAARSVVELFRDLNLQAPRIEHLSRGGRLALEEAPFTVAMGLGFAEATLEYLKKCDTWLRVGGDVVELKSQLIPRPTELEYRDVGDDFVRLLPIGWNAEQWRARSTVVRDYAIILRDTDEKGTVRFVLAGFTENGTAAAGRYLCQKWRQLWRQYVRPSRRRPTGSLGDFFVVIHGRSHDDELWEQVDELTITPVTHRRRKVSTAWSARDFKVPEASQ